MLFYQTNLLTFVTIVWLIYKTKYCNIYKRTVLILIITDKRSKIMKQLGMYWLFIGIIILLSNCKGTVEKKDNAEDGINRIAQWGFPVTDEYLQTYVGSFCYSTIFQENGKDFLSAYNSPLHSIDILNLTDKQPYRQLVLEKEGNNGILPLRGLAYHKGNFIVEDNAYYLKMDKDGKVVSRIEKDKLYSQLGNFGKMKTGQEMYWMAYNFFHFNNKTGEIAVTLYSPVTDEKGLCPIKVAVISSDDWSIKESFDIHYPDFMEKAGNLKALNCVNLLPFKDKILYNYPASSKAYCYDRTNKSVKEYDFPSNVTQSFFTLTESGDDISAGYFFPLQYDSYRDCFWRLHYGYKTPEGTLWKKRPLVLTCISSDLKSAKEYSLPEDIQLYPNVLIAQRGILLPYLQGLTETDIYFYNLEVSPMHSI